MIFFQSSHKKGFTLVEMMVSISLFMLVSIVAIGALLRIVDANKKAQSLKTTMNNINFIMESLSREMRVGTTYLCTAGDVTIPTTLSTSYTHDAENIDPSCAGSGIAGAWKVAFNSSKTDGASPPGCHYIIAYYFHDNTLEKAEQSACGQALTWYPLLTGTTASVSTSTINFDTAVVRVVTETDPTNPSDPAIQPFAQFHFVGSAGAKEKNRSYFDLQTTVSQRISD